MSRIRHNIHAAIHFPRIEREKNPPLRPLRELPRD
jgi:hypothetical protein